MHLEDVPRLKGMLLACGIRAECHAEKKPVGTCQRRCPSVRHRRIEESPAMTSGPVSVGILSGVQRGP